MKHVFEKFDGMGQFSADLPERMEKELLVVYKQFVSGEVGILNDHRGLYLLLQEKFGILEDEELEDSEEACTEGKFNYERVFEEAVVYAKQATEDARIPDSPFGCGWGWLDVSNLRSGLGRWMLLEHKAGRRRFYHHSGTISFGTNHFGQCVQKAELFARKMSEFLNEGLSGDTKTGTISYRSNLD